jgi:hypothetical protein
LRYIPAVRQGDRLAAILILLSLLVSFGDFPYVDEFFPDPTSSQLDDQQDDNTGTHLGRTAHIASCFVAFANLVGLPADASKTPRTASPQVATRGMQPHVSGRHDRIERPPA